MASPAPVPTSAPAGGPPGAQGPPTPTPTPCADLHCIQHVVVVVLENQSFDRLFGQFSNGNSTDGAVDGLPTDTAGHVTTCLPDPRGPGYSEGTSPTPTPLPCLPPYHVPWNPPTSTPTAYCSNCPLSPTPTLDQQDNPHSAAYAATDVAGVPAPGGLTPTPMTGFLASAWSWCLQPNSVTSGYAASNPACATPAPGATAVPFDVLRYMEAGDIPTDWYYGQYYTIQDHLFAPVASYSLPSHLFQVSGWSATCAISGTPTTCTNELSNPQSIVNAPGKPPTPQPYPKYAWTDMTYLLDHHQAYVDAGGTPVPTTTPGAFCGTDALGTPGVYINAQGTPIPTTTPGACVSAPLSWKYYIADHTQNDCPGYTDPCNPIQQGANGTVEYWNPLPFFSTVHTDGTPGPGIPTPYPNTPGQTSYIQYYYNFQYDAITGTLPAVSWLAPDLLHSDHAPFSLLTGPNNGEALLQWIIATLSGGTPGDHRYDQWAHTAVFVAWDDWGGFYDHVLPPTPTGGGNGYGIRVPGIVISPYVKHCYVDKQTLSFDAYNRFIEDDFLSGQRLDGTTDGRPDPRATWEPVPRETALPGDLRNDFSFGRSTFAPPVTTPLPVATPGNVYPTPGPTWCGQ